MLVNRRTRREQGFTLIELMMVVGIIGILAAVAMGSYRHFTDKAKAVEAEVALTEVDRLQQLHHANYGSYSSDLNAIGFAMASSLKFYRVEVRVFDGGATFQAMALPLVGAGTQQKALVLSHPAGGGVSLTSADPGVLAAQLGSGSGGNSASSPMATPGGAMSGSGSDQSKPGCEAGGEATLAEDGRLDMNFCFKTR